MTGQPPTANKRSIAAEVVISLGLFLVALIPRLYALDRFVTADEAKWVYRSAQFLAAFLQGDWAGTTVNLTPAVTTTWLGGLGLALYHSRHRAELGLPLAEWLRSLPEFRVELPVLVAARWPMALFTALAVVALYWLTRRLFNRPVALLAAALVALSPHMLALSRILGHDAPAAMFAALSLLALLGALLPARSAATRLLMALSGALAGLAFLSKAPALFLTPFAGLLIIAKIWQDRARWPRWMGLLLLWGVTAWLTFVLVWPAAWVDPLGRPWAVVENAFLSATDTDEADSENYWRVPDLGPAYYVVNGSFKLSPLVMVGSAIALIFLAAAAYQRRLDDSPPAAVLLWLLLFVALFTIFMTFGTKRSARYILPIFPPLAVVAAWGWDRLGQVAGLQRRKGVGKRRRDEGGRMSGVGEQAERRQFNQPTNKQTNPLSATYHSPFTIRNSQFIIIFLAALLIQLPYAPYYFTYFNPLLGGPVTAPHVVKLGWGEGLDRVGRFLQRELPGSRVGTPYSSTVAPYFAGDLSNVTGDRLDYVVLYRKQVQSGEPFPEGIRYFEETGHPIFSVPLNGIDYADVYVGPGVQPAAVDDSASSRAAAAQPVGFRPLLPYGPIGQSLNVDVVWPVENRPSNGAATLTLHPPGQLDSSPLAQSTAPPEAIAPDMVVSRHTLPLSSTLKRGSYALAIDGRLLGQIDLRHFYLPDALGKITDVVFDDQIALVGYNFEPNSDYLRITTAWQAEQRYLPDYTVFVQLLDAETNTRLAGIDTQPLRGEWPTSRWALGEVVVDEYLVAVPPDLPPGHYNIIVGLYRPETGQRLTLANGRDHWLVPWTFIWK